MDLIENTLLSQNIQRHPWEKARFFFIKKQIQTQIQQHPHKKITIIDIGCGDAYILSNLYSQLNIHTAIGIDINFTPTQIQNLTHHHPHIQFSNHLNTIPIQNNVAYIILLNDVIEHISQHLHFIQHLKQTFIDKTPYLALFITVPAYQFLFSQHDVDLGHYRRYTTQQLQQYNTILNMKITTQGYFFFSLFLARFIIKQYQPKNPSPSSHKTHKIGVNHWQQSSFMSSLITTILIIDAIVFNTLHKYLKIKFPGLSAYILFNKA